MLSAANVSINFDGKHILENANFHIKKGELIYLLGKNGSGKSTLFKMITNEYDFYSGKINVNGKLGYQRQKSVLLRNMTVNENIQSFDILLGSDLSNEKKDEIIKFFELDTVKNVSVDKISGGQQQRLSLAITMMRNKDIYLIDEADSAMDPVGRSIFFKCLKRLKNEGKTVIWISHHIKESLDTADKCYLLSNRKILELEKASIDPSILNYREEEIVNYIEKELEIGDKVN